MRDLDAIIKAYDVRGIYPDQVNEDLARDVGDAVLRQHDHGRAGGPHVIDEITGALIVWNHASEQFSVQGAAPVGSGPAGRARAVFTPPAGSAAASTPAGGKTGAGPR